MSILKVPLTMPTKIKGTGTQFSQLRLCFLLYCSSKYKHFYIQIPQGKLE